MKDWKDMVYNEYFFNCNNVKKKNEYEKVCFMYNKKLSERKERYEKYRSWKAKHKKPTRLHYARKARIKRLANKIERVIVC